VRAAGAKNDPKRSKRFAVISERDMMNWTYGWIGIWGIAFCVFLFRALQDRHHYKKTLAAEAERVAKTEAAEAERVAERSLRRSTTVCVKCGERLPKWFVNRFEELGGNVCFRCETGGFEPYPEPDQTEDVYVMERKARHAALLPGSPPKNKDEE
jgi:hypothetical protein